MKNYEQYLKYRRKKLLADNKRIAFKQWHYFKKLKKGERDIIMGNWEKKKREELLTSVKTFGGKLTVEGSYSVDYNTKRIIVSEIDPDGYEDAIDFIDLELAKLIDDIPYEKLAELDTQSKELKKGGSGGSYQKPTYDSKPKQSGGYQKKTYQKKTYNKQAETNASPYGQNFGSKSQWNKIKYNEDFVRNELGVDPSNISDLQMLGDIVGDVFEYEKEKKGK